MGWGESAGARGPPSGRGRSRGVDGAGGAAWRLRSEVEELAELGGECTSWLTGWGRRYTDRMMIVWGKKIVRKRRGLSAEFCPVCRDVRVFEAVERWLVPHVYFIPAGRRTFLGGELCCESCGAVLWVETEVVRRAERARSPDIVGMARRTSALGESGLAERLALEGRVRAGRLSVDERRSLLRESFAALAYRAAERERGGVGESMIATACAGSILTGFPFLIAVWDLSQPGRSEPWVFWVATVGGALFAVSTVAAVWLIVHQKRLTARRYVLPFIAKSLAPLRPTGAEVEGAIADAAAAGLASVNGIGRDELMRAIGREAGR